jgi:hypothetical protein
MPLAADAVENDARDTHGGIVRGESPHHGRGRLRLSGDIEDQHDGQPKARGEVGRGARAAAWTGRAVEQPHDAFDEQ